MHRKLLSLMTITVIGVLLSIFIIGTAVAGGKKSEIGAKQITTQIQKALIFGATVINEEREVANAKVMGPQLPR